MCILVCLSILKANNLNFGINLYFLKKFISKFKFIRHRMERNEYTKQFMKELREVNTTTGSLSRVDKCMRF